MTANSGSCFQKVKPLLISPNYIYFNARRFITTPSVRVKNVFWWKTFSGQIQVAPRFLADKIWTKVPVALVARRRTATTFKLSGPRASISRSKNLIFASALFVWKWTLNIRAILKILNFSKFLNGLCPNATQSVFGATVRVQKVWYVRVAVSCPVVRLSYLSSSLGKLFNDPRFFVRAGNLISDAVVHFNQVFPLVTLFAKRFLQR